MCEAAQKDDRAQLGEDGSVGLRRLAMKDDTLLESWSVCQSWTGAPYMTGPVSRELETAEA
jgi:hypothetical protein